MLKLFKKAFWIFCDDVTACPSIADTQAAIAKYCKDSGYSCVLEKCLMKTENLHKRIFR